MRMTKDRKRTHVALTVTSPVDESGGSGQPDDQGPIYPWLLVSSLGGLAAAATGWLLIIGLVLVVWFTAMAMPFTRVLEFATKMWLVTHFAGADIGPLELSIAPLGLTVVCGIVAAIVGGYAARQALAAAERVGDAPDRGPLVLRVTAMSAVVYALAAGAMALAVGAPGRVPAACGGALAVHALFGSLGAARAVGYRPLAFAPRWFQAGLRGAGATLLTLLAISGTALAVACLAGADRIAAIDKALGFDVVGLVIWSIVQLLYLPNLLVWVMAYVLGAGFTVGTTTVVSPALTHLGMLPSIPVFGAVPLPGPGGPAAYAWMASGVLAGVVGALVAVRGTRRAPGLVLPLDRTVGAGAIAGLGAALAVVGVAAVSGGDLGQLRLISLGPRVGLLALLAPATLGLSAALTATIAWALFRRRGDLIDDDPEETVALIGDEATSVLLRDEPTRKLPGRPDAGEDGDVATAVLRGRDEPTTPLGSRDEPTTPLPDRDDHG